jgi:hypothetical protein
MEPRTVNIQHSSRSDQWGTPSEIIELVREVLGSIYFDPCSSLEFNETIQAKHFWTEKALEREWLGGSIYCNPPGGKTGNKSNTVLFWQKLLASKFDHAIFMAFSLEALQTTQKPENKSIGEFPICIPSKRIRFVSLEGYKNAPSHSNCIVYVPGLLNESKRFKDAFSKIGVVLNV